MPIEIGSAAEDLRLVSSFFVEPNDFARHRIFPGVEIQTVWGRHVMLSLVEFEAGAVVEPHSHPHEQMGMLLEGELEFTIGGETRLVKPGQMWRIPGGVVHQAKAIGGPVRALDVFYPIREDYQ